MNTTTKSKQIIWAGTRVDHELIRKIVVRAMRLKPMGYDRFWCDMALTACHLNGNPLKLAELLAADDFTFAHDVFGIVRHIDLETGQLKDCFSPRLSAPVKDL